MGRRVAGHKRMTGLVHKTCEGRGGAGEGAHGGPLANARAIHQIVSHRKAGRRAAGSRVTAHRTSEAGMDARRALVGGWDVKGGPRGCGWEGRVGRRVGSQLQVLRSPD